MSDLKQLDSARTHYTAREWEEAISGFEAVGRNDLPLADHERLAWSRLWTLAPAAECLDAFENLEAVATSAGDVRMAARAAIEQIRIHAMLGHQVVASSCWHRAVGLVDGIDCPEAAMCQALGALGASQSGKTEGLEELATTALESGLRVDDPTSVALAKYLLGSNAVEAGELERGQQLIDDAMEMSINGEVHPLYSGLITCGVVMVCRVTGDWRRAHEWNEVADRYCARESVAHFPGHCSVFRSELTRVSGNFASAAEEAIEAMKRAGDWSETWLGMAYHQLGEAELCQGRLDEAQQAFSQAIELGYDPQPGQARLLAAQGRYDAAQSLLRQTLDRSDGYAKGEAVLTLIAAVPIAISAGDLLAAKKWAGRLHDLATLYATPAVEVAAIQAQGQLALAENRLDEAESRLRDAIQAWGRIDAPYDAARTRVTLASTLERAGRTDEADLERDIAASSFERLGAVLDLAALGPASASATKETRTFSFTDIVNSTQLLEAMGDDEWGRVLAVHDRLLRDLLAQHGGTEVKHEGDGFFVCFANETSAVNWAVAIQRQLANHREHHGFTPHIRVGVHSGEALRYGNDFIGRCVNETARIAAAAGADEILASASTAQNLPDTMTVIDERILDLKGFAEPQPVVLIGWSQ
ncbi:MAG: adenylate/guanylate cyclase domain-containing protein [Acidimicrobiales bacterium]